MSQHLNYCPRAGATRAPKDWPRVYAQRGAASPIFELHRGAISHCDAYAAANGGFGREWSVWIERRPEPRSMIGAHRPRLAA